MSSGKAKEVKQHSTSGARDDEGKEHCQGTQHIGERVEDVGQEHNS